MKSAGFWVRFLASLIDVVLLAIPMILVVYAFFGVGQFDLGLADISSMNKEQLMALLLSLSMQGGSENLILQIVMIVVTVLFWRKYSGATPGKMLLKIKIVDAKTENNIDTKQAVVRSIGYIASTLTLLIGYLMVGFRDDKRALHDLLAGTKVVYR